MSKMDICSSRNYFLRAILAQDIIGVSQCSAIATAIWQWLVVILGKFPVTGLVDIALPIKDDNYLATIVNFRSFDKSHAVNDALNPPRVNTNSS